MSQNPFKLKKLKSLYNPYPRKSAFDGMLTAQHAVFDRGRGHLNRRSKTERKKRLL